MKRRARSLEKALARKGRFGDTELAHVNRREKALLMALGGAGTRNPHTGLPEFYESDGGDTDSSNSPGGGFSDPGGGVSGGNDQPDPPTSSTPPGGWGGGDEEPSNAPGGGFTPPEGWGGGRDVFDRVGSFLENQIDPRTQQGMFNTLTGLVPGFGLASRGARGLAEALGEYVGQPLNDRFGGNAKAVDFDFGNGARFDGDPFAGVEMGPEGRNGPLGDVIARMLDATPIAAPLTPTDPGEIPYEISSFMGPGMTDLQRRALISTYGTHGVNSAFRTDPVKKYYARLLRNGLIDEQGKLFSQPYTLPIEHLYWQGVLGNPVADVGNADQIMAVANRFIG